MVDVKAFLYEGILKFGRCDEGEECTQMGYGIIRAKIYFEKIENILSIIKSVKELNLMRMFISRLTQYAVLTAPAVIDISSMFNIP